MRHVDLFSGIGGFALSATWVWGDEYENVGHSEVEAYPCKVYHRHFPESECLGDITKIDWSRFAGTIDLVTGGFPCQPHSVAGKRQGSGDERDLWSECVRAIRELRPRFALFENVPGLFTSNGGRFFERVLSDISASGYDCEWQVLSAAEVGAWHKRERVWILAYANKSVLEDEAIRPNKGESLHTVSSEQSNNHHSRTTVPRFSKDLLHEPDFLRNDDGLPNWMDRIQSLGNAIVPQCAAVIMQKIKESMQVE